jgi:PAB1-binding protein PBP1
VAVDDALHQSFMAEVPGAARGAVALAGGVEKREAARR